MPSYFSKCSTPDSSLPYFMGVKPFRRHSLPACPPVTKRYLEKPGIILFRLDVGAA